MIGNAHAKLDPPARPIAGHAHPLLTQYSGICYALRAIRETRETLLLHAQPANGLAPWGQRWLRGAARGRAVNPTPERLGVTPRVNRHRGSRLAYAAQNEP